MKAVDLDIGLDADTRGIEGGLRKTDSLLNRIGGNFIGGILTEGFVGLTSRVVDTAAGFLFANANFETMRNSLNVAMGDVDAAGVMFEKLRTFAASSPFEFPALLDAAVQLESLGVSADDYLHVIGDASAATNKSLDQTTNAFLDASMGEFERLKEYGIRAVELNGQSYLSYQKNGETILKAIDRNNQAMIQDTLAAIWNDKYAGAMETQSQTFNGRASTLKDNFLLTMTGLTRPIFEWGKSGLAFGNRFFDHFNRLRDKGLNPLEAAFEALKDAMSDTFGPSANPVRKMLTEFVASATPVVRGARNLAGLVGGALVDAFEFLIRHSDTVKGAAKGIGVMFVGLLVVTSIITGVGVALGLLLSPVTLLIGAAALVGVAYQKNLFGFGDKVRSIGRTVVTFARSFRSAWDGIGDSMNPASRFLLAFGNTLSNMSDGEGLMGTIARGAMSLARGVENLVQAGQLLYRTWRGLIDQGFSPAQALIQALTALLPGLSGVINEYAAVVTNLFDAFTAFARGDVGVAFRQLGEAAGHSVLLLVELFKAIPWTDAMGGIRDIFGRVFESVSSPSTATPVFRGFLGPLSWAQFIPGLNWGSFVGSLLWSLFVMGVNLTASVNRLLWSAFVTAVDLTSKVTMLAWGAYVGAVKLTEYVGDLFWSLFVTGVTLTDYVHRLIWSLFVTGFDFIKDGLVTALKWSEFILNTLSMPSIDDFLNFLLDAVADIIDGMKAAIALALKIVDGILAIPRALAGAWDNIRNPVSDEEILDSGLLVPKRSRGVPGRGGMNEGPLKHRPQGVSESQHTALVLGLLGIHASELVNSIATDARQHFDGVTASVRRHTPDWLATVGGTLGSIGSTSGATFTQTRQTADTNVTGMRDTGVSQTNQLNAGVSGTISATAMGWANRLGAMLVSTVSSFGGIRSTGETETTVLSNVVGNRGSLMASDTSSRLGRMSTGLRGDFQSMRSSAVTESESLRSGVGREVGTMQSGTTSAIAAGNTRMVGAVGDTRSSSTIAARGFSFGLVAAIQFSVAAGMGLFRSAASGLSTTALGAMVGAAMISSPSRVFTLLGRLLIHGLVIGMLALSQDVAAVSTDVVTVASAASLARPLPAPRVEDSLFSFEAPVVPLWAEGATGVFRPAADAEEARSRTGDTDTDTGFDFDAGVRRTMSSALDDVAREASAGRFELENAEPAHRVYRIEADGFEAVLEMVEELTVLSTPEDVANAVNTDAENITPIRKFS